MWIKWLGFSPFISSFHRQGLKCIQPLLIWPYWTLYLLIKLLILFLIMTKGGERILVNQLLKEAKLLCFLGLCSGSERERRRMVKIVAWGTCLDMTIWSWGFQNIVLKELWTIFKFFDSGSELFSLKRFFKLWTVWKIFWTLKMLMITIRTKCVCIRF